MHALHRLVLARTLDRAMRCIAFAALLACCLATRALAQAVPELVLPERSGLQLAPARQSAQSTQSSQRLVFSGSATVHGSLLAQWLPNVNGDGSPGRSYRLLLAPESAAHLPHYQSLPLQYIEVSNGQSLLASATSKAIAAQFKARKRAVVAVQGLFTLKQFSMGGACRNAAAASIGQVDAMDVSFPARAEAVDCKP